MFSPVATVFWIVLATTNTPIYRQFKFIVRSFALHAAKRLATRQKMAAATIIENPVAIFTVPTFSDFCGLFVAFLAGKITVLKGDG